MAEVKVYKHHASIALKTRYRGVVPTQNNITLLDKEKDILPYGLAIQV